MDETKWKYQIGQVLKDGKRDLVIIDKKIKKRKSSERKDRWYMYKCNKCTAELWKVEDSLVKGVGCACCCLNPQRVVKGINDISTTNPWMIKYFVDINDAYIHTYCSSKKILMKCPNCGGIEYKKISTMHSFGYSCLKCSDGISFGEKFIYNLLVRLNLDFVKEYTPKWDRLGNRRYDFYFNYNNNKYIIEIHGLQHYENANRIWTALEDEQQNDKLKKELAINNGIKENNYIIIDCRFSELEFIKRNIINSELNNIFNLDNVDWIKIHKNSQKSILYTICDYKNEHDFTSSKIASLLKLDKTTIIKYLKTGTLLGLCDYDSKKEAEKTLFKTGRIGSNSKPVEIFKDEQSLGIFLSCTELERQSEKLLNTKLDHSAICRVCKGKLKQYKGFTFKYVDDIQSA